jgi:hypothetical protein
MSRYRNPAEIDTVIIHCADTPNGRPFFAADIDVWHHKRGFERAYGFITRDYPLLAIGYHCVITVDGRIEYGRKMDETGAHCKGFNRRSVGICLIGRDAFSAPQWIALKQKVVALQNAYPNIIRVMGHREFNPHKTCPGFDVAAWLDGGMNALEGHIIED